MRQRERGGRATAMPALFVVRKTLAALIWRGVPRCPVYRNELCSRGHVYATRAVTRVHDRVPGSHVCFPSIPTSPSFSLSPACWAFSPSWTRMYVLLLSRDIKPTSMAILRRFLRRQVPLGCAVLYVGFYSAFRMLFASRPLLWAAAIWPDISTYNASQSP